MKTQFHNILYQTEKRRKNRQKKGKKRNRQERGKKRKKKGKEKKEKDILGGRKTRKHNITKFNGK